MADLVAQTFSQNGENEKPTARQDFITIGGGSDTTSLDQNMISGIIKVLGFDGAKIGAAAVNGIIFMAQMVRFGVNRVVNYTMSKMWDWYQIVDYITDRIRKDNSTMEIVHNNPDVNITALVYN